MTRQLLVTSALPYANGHVHIGHMVEYLQTDIWVRFQRLFGNRCHYICADDTHGTSIMIRAKLEGRSEEALIAEMSQAHQADFKAFQIEFDHYGSTNSAANRALCGEFWQALRSEGLVVQKEVTQLYDAQAGIFLADRFVKGNCPSCNSPDQYGDNCEKCNAAYSAVDLKNPRSIHSGSVPELRNAQHLFVQVEKLHAYLEEWTTSGTLQPEIANYLKGHFLSAELRDWDVSRPAPYFGFEIPDAPGNFWYVWFDAPIGYLASTQEWCAATGQDFSYFWRSEAVEIHHFIGKDIVYFHTLFWPAMLKVAGYSLPRRVHVHGFLTVNGEKMSKSKGTQVKASSYLEHLDPAYLRYYYASKLNAGVDDLDLNLEEFIAKVNSDLVGKVVNLASRTARFAKSLGLAEVYPADGGLFQNAALAGAEIAKSYEDCDFAKATRLIMALADRANEYIDRVEPWKLAKAPERAAELQEVCTVALNLYRQLVLYLSPILPKLATDSAVLLNCSFERWELAQTPLLGTKIGEFSHLMTRVDPKKVQAMIDSSIDVETDAAQAKAANAVASGAADAAAAAAVVGAGGAGGVGGELVEGGLDEPLASTITVDELGKVDLRVARILKAEAIPEADKLLKLTVSLGGNETRTVFAGIKSAYTPESLEGQLVVIVANLAPRKMRFGTSEGMVLAAGAGGKELFLMSPHSGAKPGQRLH